LRQKLDEHSPDEAGIAAELRLFAFD